MTARTASNVSISYDCDAKDIISLASQVVALQEKVHQKRSAVDKTRRKVNFREAGSRARLEMVIFSCQAEVEALTPEEQVMELQLTRSGCGEHED